MTTNVFQKHQIKIAKQTLRLSEARPWRYIGASIMGGMDHAKAREVLKDAGWSEARISKWEDRS